MSDYIAAVMRALRFWTRLPMPILPFEVDPHALPAMERLAPAVPIVGLIVGLIGAAVLVAALACGLGEWPAAILAVGTMIVVTGAMHEDALADVADGFGGGATVEEKLEIMKDPNLGSFGATALILVLMLKVSALASLAGAGSWRGACGLIGAAVLSRVVGLWPLVTLPPARSGGMGAAAGQLSMEAWRHGGLIGFAVALVLAFFAAGIWSAILALVAAASAAFGFAWLSGRQIGGQTGDICGAATLLSEAFFLLALLVSTGF